VREEKKQTRREKTRPFPFPERPSIKAVAHGSSLSLGVYTFRSLILSTWKRSSIFENGCDQPM
jgi:hypothetical protein